MPAGRSDSAFQGDKDPLDQGVQRAKVNDEHDNRFGFNRYSDRNERIGWLINIHPGDLLDENKRLISAVDYYFIQEDGGRFKVLGTACVIADKSHLLCTFWVSLPYAPYFYVAAKPGTERDVTTFLSKRFGSVVQSVDAIQKEDLDLPNHLIGLKQTYLKLSFLSVSDLMKVRKELMPRIRRNMRNAKSRSAYTELLTNNNIGDSSSRFGNGTNPPDQMDNLIDIREYDVPYHVRVSIDRKLFVGKWYSVTGSTIGKPNVPEIVPRPDIIEPPDPIVLAFDIETTKSPLKFPDAMVDQIMMISYMIDGQGYLIVNREVVASDIEGFDFNPKPEYNSHFVVFNESNEVSLLQRFFDHVQDVQPHIFVTYNGDAFDWPFVEARASVYGLDLFREIGFQKDTQDEYKCRPCIHMDAFKWVKRDSYLPVGSQNLKACAKAKLRYDPVELDPEEMCLMAAEQPQHLASYSVSDAVATYYLYMKYVHPFIFALCTIIPMEPDEVLRKGSGTLCEALLMVEAFHANIIFPNKQETVLNKMTEDGHLLDQETYVGGHVEAIESGIFRADIPCRFRMVPDTYQQLIDGVESTLRHAIEDEEKVKLDLVTNFEEVCGDIKAKLEALRDCPARLEHPIIYHLDVGAMYPNIILTNRLQPPAIVDETVCAACDFNKPGARCQRTMTWMWRGEIIPATRSEYNRVVQQLESERFPPTFPNGPHRAFHQLPREEQAALEKQRLQEYCRKAYKRLHDTRLEERHTTICQRENSFYVDTVRAFRDRRYEFKDMLKTAKKQLTNAMQNGDAVQIKSAKAKEILFDSLQLAHKCILNSFYGYVMRKGSRWHSMEMAGIVCYTGAGIIKQARELVEQIGRPLELDTDGIWCVLPASFPENYVLETLHDKKPKVTISYPGAMLNMMVKQSCTNDQYHELVDAANLKYVVRAENSIFFEVDGPYHAMVLPAAKEEGKKLKKRYAVFNFDGSLAELKGFEVKRRGELELIKIFQSQVFEAFLKGETLEEAYHSVAEIANYWLDVLFAKGADLPDTELFDLISENRNMSRKLEEYGKQKSVSISTARRLAEFLGDQMVKDAGLSCRYIIAKKPEGAPVTERAIPLAIFQAEPSIRKHFLRKWLKAHALASCDIRDILDWDYYVERLGSAIQKIITIPAALQGVSNPVPRINHPDWLHKRLLEKNDILKQKRINEIFKKVDKKATNMNESATLNGNAVDIEEIVNGGAAVNKAVVGAAVHTTDRRYGRAIAQKGRMVAEAAELAKPWQEILGKPPQMGNTLESQHAWLAFQKQKWQRLARQRAERRRQNLVPSRSGDTPVGGSVGSAIGSFIRRAAQSLLESPWQILQVCETQQPGVMKLWVLLGTELHELRLRVPHIFYINTKVPKEDAGSQGKQIYEKVQKILPRSNPRYHLYRYKVSEELYQQNLSGLYTELSIPEIEGMYETQVPLMFRVLTQLGCVCQVAREKRRALVGRETDMFDLDQLEFLTLADCDYLGPSSIRHLYLYHYLQGKLSMMALFVPSSKHVHVFVVGVNAADSTIPNMQNMYTKERTEKCNKILGNDVALAALPKDNYQFELHFEKDHRAAYRNVQKHLMQYKSGKHGPTVVAIQSNYAIEQLLEEMPSIHNFPFVKLFVAQKDNLYGSLNWQSDGARHIVQQFLNVDIFLMSYLEQCRYLHIPLGNVPQDVACFGADLFFARHLMKQNHVLWCSQTDRPDLGGKEVDDNRLITGMEENGLNIELNQPGVYHGLCVELELVGLPVATLLQAHNLHELEGASSATGFDTVPQLSIDQLVSGNSGYKMLASYDETALSAPAFRILKTMVHGWVRDITDYQNVYADHQIIHFYRWLRSPQALLYDPALRKTLHALMRKLFMQLIAELRTLGANIVYADFNRIVLSTKKRTAPDALAYVGFVLQSLQRRELFGSLEITVRGMWNLLFWLDPANHGGIRARDDEAGSTTNAGVTEAESEMPTAATPVPSAEDDLVEVDMNWTMMDHLPQDTGCQDHFKTLVANYIAAVYKLLKVDFFVQPTSTPMRVREHGSQTSQDVAVPGYITSKCQHYLSEEIAQRLLGIVIKVQQRVAASHKARQEGTHALFPVLPGSHLRFTNPALELIKTVCKVLSLDAGVQLQVTTLRRDALRLIGVGEFADVAQWQDPCTSHKLLEMTCQYCNHCRDVDLCRDYSYTSADGELVTWRCVQCKREYDHTAIECQLLQAMNQLSMSYVLQDLSCEKCRGVKQAHMPVCCECAGRFQQTSSSIADLQQKLRTFRNIASLSNMPLVFETVTAMLQANGWSLAN